MAEALPPFQVFLDEHLAAVRAFLRGMVRGEELEDCMQETFLAALRAYPRASGENLRAWVLTIASRKAIDHHRSRARRPIPVAEVPEPSGDDEPLGMGRRDSAVWAAVAELPPQQRAAVVLRYAVDLRYRDVGEALGCTEEAARRSVHDGLRKLRLSAAELREEAA